MSDPREIVQNFITARNAQDSAAAIALLADDFEWRVARSAGPPLHGERAINALVGGLSKKLYAHDSITRTVHRILADGDAVVVEYSVSGETIDGKPYDNDYCWIYDTSDGKIVRISTYSDTLGSARAFGEERINQGLAELRK
jgi:ketosteroid isomerase-like protein